MKNKDFISGASSLVGATFIYSFFGVLTRMLGFSLPLFYGIWVRNLACVLILASVLLISKKWIQIQGKDWKWFLFRSIAGFLGYLGSYLSFYYIPIGTAYFMFYGGSTIGGYILGKILFNEHLTKIKIISLVMAVAGLLLIYSLNLHVERSLYTLLAIGAGLGAAIWNVSSKKISSAYSDMQLNFMDFVISFIMMFSVSLLLREPWVAPSLNTAWITNVLFLVMFLSTGQLMVYGFRHISAQIGSLIMLAEVLFGIVWGTVLYKEVLSLWTVLGGILVLTAIVLPEIRLKKLKP